ncbi:hypothetical protein ACFCP7_22325 [Paenibacillus elgii]
MTFNKVTTIIATTLCCVTLFSGMTSFAASEDSKKFGNTTLTGKLTYSSKDAATRTYTSTKVGYIKATIAIYDEFGKQVGFDTNARNDASNVATGEVKRGNGVKAEGESYFDNREYGGTYGWVNTNHRW